MAKRKSTKPARTEAPAPEIAPEDEAIEAAAEERREKIVQADANREWLGQALHPWSEERARLLESLCAADIPLPDPESCNDVAFYHGMFARAVKLLFLLHHSPEEIRPHRSRLLCVIDEWGVEHVPGATIKQKRDAVHFMIEVENAHKAVMAIRRTVGKPSGN